MELYFSTCELDVNVFREEGGKQNNRKLLSWKKLDICKLYSDLNSYPFIREVIKFIDRRLNGLLHECPYTSIEINNMTTSVSDNFDPTNSFMPNGKMKMELLFYNNRDKNILSLRIRWRRNII